VNELVRLRNGRRFAANFDDRARFARRIEVDGDAASAVSRAAKLPILLPAFLRKPFDGFVEIAAGSLSAVLHSIKGALVALAQGFHVSCVIAMGSPHIR